MRIKDFGEICNHSFKEDGFSWSDNFKQLWRSIEKKDGETENKLVMSGLPQVLEFYILDDGEGKVKLTNGIITVEVSLNKLKEAKGWNGLFLRGETIVVNLHKDKVPLLLSALLKFYDHKRVDVIEYEGLHNNEVLTTGITYKKDGVSEVNTCRTVGNISKVMEVKQEKLSEDDVVFLKENLHKFRGLNAIGWFVACWFKLDSFKFPILGDFRITSKGKTAGMEALLNINFGVQLNSKVACQSLTNAQLKRFFTMSNVVPVIVDDYKSNEKKNYRIDIESVMRTAFEGGKMVQATVSKDMLEFDIIRPMAITGENPLINESSNNRMILVDDVKCSTQLYDEFTKDDYIIFKKIGYEVMQKRLEVTEKEIMKKLENINLNLTKQFPSINSRILKNYAVVQIGLNYLNEILGTSYEVSIENSESTKYNLYDAVVEILKLVIIDGKYMSDFADERIVKDFKEKTLYIPNVLMFELYKKALKDEMVQSEEILSNKEFKNKIPCEKIELIPVKKISGKTHRNVLAIKFDFEEI